MVSVRSSIRRPALSVEPPRFRLILISGLAAITGILGGIAAYALEHLIGLVTNMAFYGRFSTEIVQASPEHFGLLIIFVPAIGGLLIGLMARYGTELVRGHGIPEAMEAVLVNKSRIPPKVAILKPISAAISIGSGQPFGAEGPIIQTGAAIGSVLGQTLRMTTAERKVLLACGSAAGLAAVFGTPIAGVVFSIELLLFEFRARSFIPLVIAATLATEIHVKLFSPDPVFTAGAINFGSPTNLAFFLVLGLLSGLAAMLLTKLLYVIEDWFHHLSVNTYLWPALGGLFVGIVGYIFLRIDPRLNIFGPGYTEIGGTLAGQYAFGFLIVLLIGKSSVWLVSLGSGTSGGVLAPVFLMGAALGGAFGLLMKQFFPGMDAAPQAFALVGMAAVFGSATRATFAAILFAFEMTRNYDAVLPVMFACVIADVVVNRLTPTSILTEQLRRNGVPVHHEYQADMLDMVIVAAVMVKDVVTVPPTMTVRELVDKINQHDPRFIRHQAQVVVDDTRHVLGIITRGDLLKAIDSGNTDWTVLEAGTNHVEVAYPSETVRDALTRMLQNDIGRLPVVDPVQGDALIGYLSRASIMEAHIKSLEDERTVEPGWVL